MEVEHRAQLAPAAVASFRQFGTFDKIKSPRLSGITIVNI